jgi:nucleotide-binding universal stress UspA family protein
MGDSCSIDEAPVVPVDGQADHIAGLDWAERFAGAVGATVDLLLAVPPVARLQSVQAATGQLLPSSTRILLDLAEEGAAGYLRCLVERLLALGIPATALVVRGDPTETIVRESARDDRDATVLLTHGLAGTKAFWAGSVAPNVVHQVTKPILLVPVHRKTARERQRRPLLFRRLYPRIPSRPARSPGPRSGTPLRSDGHYRSSTPRECVLPHREIADRSP